MSRALLLGSFDVLHYGHIETINYTARLGDVIIGLGTDDYQRIYKHQPVLTFEERKQQLEALPQVSRVVARPEINATPLFEKIQPDYFVAGMDWFEAPHLEMTGIDKDYLNENGITLVYLPRGHQWSTSEIIKRIREGVAV